MSLDMSIGSYDGILSFRFDHVLSWCLLWAMTGQKGKMERICILCPRKGWWSPIRKPRSFKMKQIQNSVQHLSPRQDGSILSAHQSRPGSSSLFFFDQTHGQYLKQKTSYSDNLFPWQSLPEMPSFRSVTLISSLTRHSSRKTMLNVRGACTPLCLNNLLNILLRISISYSVNMPCTSQNDLLFNSQARNAYHVRGKNEET